MDFIRKYELIEYIPLQQGLRPSFSSITFSSSKAH